MPEILLQKALQYGVPPQGAAQVYALSLWKALVAPYLARSFTVDDRTAAFLHAYSELARRLPSAMLMALATDDHLLWRDEDHLITFKMEHVITDEGEMTLHYRVGSQPLYGMSFSIVPGRLVSSGASTVLLLTRMQGRSGLSASSIRGQAKARPLSPQTALFAALIGLARAADLPIVGVAASNQISWTPERDVAFGSVYDQFYETVDGRPLGEAFYWLPVDAKRRPLGEIVIAHRRRTRRRREERDAISLAAAAGWNELLKGTPRPV